MPAFHPAYLIHGDDHGRVAERRARLRAMAEAASGPAGVEIFEGDACTPDAVAAALSAMTFAVGRRFVIADGVERWKVAETEAVVAALAGVDTETTTVAFFAREDARVKAPESLHKAVEKAGGKVAAESALKPRELPGWLAEQAQALGVELDKQAARALVAQVGDRRQRLLRELEKLALEHGPGASIGVEEVQESGASSVDRKVWTLADALVAGDRRTALRSLIELRQQGERIPGLIFGMARRVRDAVAVAEQLAAGKSEAQVKKTLRMPSFAADRFLSDVGKRDLEGLRKALIALADLELQSRGGGAGGMGEETAAVRAVVAATA